MENFFYEETFHHDLDSLISGLDLDDDGAINELEENWEIEVEDTTLEKIFILKENFVVDAISESTDRWEDRFPEDHDDRTYKKIQDAIKQGVNVEKINDLLPSLYYPNGQKYKITKADLLEYVN